MVGAGYLCRRIPCHLRVTTGKGEFAASSWRLLELALDDHWACGSSHLWANKWWLQGMVIRSPLRLRSSLGSGTSYLFRKTSWVNSWLPQVMGAKPSWWKTPCCSSDWPGDTGCRIGLGTKATCSRPQKPTLYSTSQAWDGSRIKSGIEPRSVYCFVLDALRALKLVRQSGTHTAPLPSHTQGYTQQQFPTSHTLGCPQHLAPTPYKWCCTQQLIRHICTQLPTPHILYLGEIREMRRREKK